MTSVLVVVAHPDDAEIAMGMRIHWYALNGATVRVHCLTTGTPAPDGTEVRRQECLSAGELLGVDRYTFSSIPDTRFVEHRGRINADLFDVFREARPDIVYTHYPGDQHLDHSVTAREVTTVARREARNLRHFRSPYSVGFEPNEFFFGTAELLEAKVRALKCFASQTQLDMDVFRQLTELAYRQHLHHNVVADLPAEATCAELFSIARQIHVATAPQP
ncbi:PIG-L deacetylase family protein [Streptomyces anthocyanicus]|uniref:PIG-L deacetylase family protein n=1 Tax=Streptomyces anthocyanicus TaxID=68174 RepID=UPI0037F17FAF